jgi:medium-chain acyl-[acyl-carrier-protein] hydrolase
MLSHNSLSRKKENAWFSFPEPKADARLRLYCFPYAGGSSSIFRNWAEEIPGEVEICLVQLPGRGARVNETPFTRVDSLVEEIADALEADLDKPFAFFGHSMGGILSFELAQWMRGNRGREPAQLFISGRCAPQIRNSEEITYNLPEPEFIKKLRQLNGTPKEAFEHAELMSLMIPILRADFEVCQTYSYEPCAPLSCGIVVYGGIDDEEVSRTDLEAWRDQTTGQYGLRMLPGDHFFVNSSKRLLLKFLSSDLRQLIAPLDKM